MAHVLVVEDDPDVRASVCDVLEDEGHRVVSACNGLDAMSVLAGDERPSVIVLDLMMPVMNGYQVLAALREDARLASIPVIVTSASAKVDVDTMARAIVRKPYLLDDLIDTVARLACMDQARAA